MIMKARELMTARPACCTPNDTVERAAQLMEQNDCGCIPVVERTDRQNVIGVVTDRDVAIRAVAHGRGAETPVGDVMTMAPCCVSADTEVQTVERLMSDNQIRRVVVTDDDGCCIGIVAQADLARAADRGNEVSDDEVGRVVERISEPGRSEWRL
jgi:CBS domain-containing protein